MTKTGTEARNRGGKTSTPRVGRALGQDEGSHAPGQRGRPRTGCTAAGQHTGEEREAGGFGADQVGRRRRRGGARGKTVVKRVIAGNSGMDKDKGGVKPRSKQR